MSSSSSNLPEPESSSASATPAQQYSNKPMLNRIDMVINETALYLAQYLGGMERFEERFDAAVAFIQEADDVKPPSEIFRTFSEYHPL
jgi:hypothetical protein